MGGGVPFLRKYAKKQRRNPRATTTALYVQRLCTLVYSRSFQKGKATASTVHTAQTGLRFYKLHSGRRL